jgi:NAD(P)H-nitrite reductase large subunit
MSQGKMSSSPPATAIPLTAAMTVVPLDSTRLVRSMIRLTNSALTFHQVAHRPDVWYGQHDERRTPCQYLEGTPSSVATTVPA